MPSEPPPGPWGPPPPPGRDWGAPPTAGPGPGEPSQPPAAGAGAGPWPGSAGPGTPTGPTGPGPSGPAAPEDRPAADGVARRTNPLTVATGIASLAGATVVFGLQLVLTPGRGQPPWLLVVFGLFLGVRGISDTLGWFLRTYAVSADRLVIDEGVLTRHHRVVPFERVQQIDVSQDLIGQALGLAAVRIDSAGEGGTTVHLKLLDKQRAEGLRSFVLERRAALQALRAAGASTASTATGPVAPAPPPPEHALLRVGAGRLALSVLAGPLAIVGIGLVAVGLATAAAIAVTGDGVAAAATVATMSLVGAVGLAVLGVSGSVLNLWDLTVSRVGDDLRLSHGLLQVRTLTLPRRRVQHVTVVDGPLQRALGFASLTLHSAAPPSAAAGNQTNVAGRFWIPYVARDELPATLHRLLGGDWAVPALTPRGPAARRRAVVRRAALGALLALPALLLGAAGGVLILVGVALGWAWGLGAHRRAGWADTDRLIVLAHGLLVHRVELVPANRVQSGRTTASPFQRRQGLATAHLDIAGGSSPELYDLEVGPAEVLGRDVPRRGAAA